MSIAPEIEIRLKKAVRELLLAGRDTQNVTLALSGQLSFGKYDGCTPDAINKLAHQTVKELNAEARDFQRQIFSKVKPETKRNFVSAVYAHLEQNTR